MGISDTKAQLLHATTLMYLKLSFIESRGLKEMKAMLPFPKQYFAH